MTIGLSLATLKDLQADIRVPAYGRDSLKAGILHFGVGNFHRAHQAVYLDELFSAGHSHDWALIGAGVRPADAEMRDALAAQDWLTTVVEQDATTKNARVTGAMIDYIEPGNTIRILDTLADPAIRIVSLTITEGGYFIDAASGKFNPQHPEIQHDALNPDAPKTVFGLILAGLQRRHANGHPPFTVMSCDNIPGNGHVTADAVVGLAELSDPAFGVWIRQNVAFPNGMVDRITPATGDRERAMVTESFGVRDNWPVVCETFRQWVVEDHFPTGRPALEKVGVTFVEDVAPYELMKIRILNGGHAAIAYPAGLMDIHFVHDAMANPLVSGFLEKVEQDEILPVVPPVPDTDLQAYFQKVGERFANPTVGDTVRRLCLDGSNRQPKFILPSVNDQLARGGNIAGLAMVSALWCRYCAGTTDGGAEIAPNDPDWARLNERALAARDNPEAFLAMEDIFGPLAKSQTYVHAFSKALTAIWRDGTKTTLEHYLAGTF